MKKNMESTINLFLTNITKMKEEINVLELLIQKKVTSIQSFHCRMRKKKRRISSTLPPCFLWSLESLRKISAT